MALRNEPAKPGGGETNARRVLLALRGHQALCRAVLDPAGDDLARQGRSHPARHPDGLGKAGALALRHGEEAEPEAGRETLRYAREIAGGTLSVGRERTVVGREEAEDVVLEDRDAVRGRDLRDADAARLAHDGGGRILQGRRAIERARAEAAAGLLEGFG